MFRKYATCRIVHIFQVLILQWIGSVSLSVYKLCPENHAFTFEFSVQCTLWQRNKLIISSFFAVVVIGSRPIPLPHTDERLREAKEGSRFPCVSWGDGTDSDVTKKLARWFTLTPQCSSYASKLSVIFRHIHNANVKQNIVLSTLTYTPMYSIKPNKVKKEWHRPPNV